MIPQLLAVLYFHTLAHSFALFCIRQKLNFIVFMRLRTLRQKTGGVGGTLPIPELAPTLFLFLHCQLSTVDRRSRSGRDFQPLSSVPASLLPYLHAAKLGVWNHAGANHV